jgi:HD-GYP domain-containing protein (c-di-GMP phosphodiesterase class II)
MPEGEIESVRLAAELSDVGTVAVPDSILRKPAALDDAEMAFVRRHPIVGERILAVAPALASVARLVRSSHERVDGRGYPDGLRGDEIPLGARIVFACDSYVTMLTDRSHTGRRTEADAVAELRRCAGTQFDAAVVDALCAVLAGRVSLPKSGGPAPA